MNDKLKDFADMLDTPVLRIMGKAFFLLVIGLVIYAGRAYLHDAISGDEKILELTTDVAAAKALVASHDAFIHQQADANIKLADYFKESRESRDQMTIQLSAIIQHGTDTDSRLDRIERKIDQK